MLFGFFDFETPSPCGFPLCLLFLIPDLFAACFDLTVDVLEGAIVSFVRVGVVYRVAEACAAKNKSVSFIGHTLV